MTRHPTRKPASPTLDLQITEKQWERAKQSDSRGCLIADAIKSQYPHLSSIQVDMATVRVTDRAKGERYVYLTPESAQYLLLAFDQGWRQPTERVLLRGAVKIQAITTSKPRADARRARQLTLETKEAAGEDLTGRERQSLTKLRETNVLTGKQDRPTGHGPATLVEQTRDGAGKSVATIRGGRPPLVGEPHPNLLRGRRRAFGATLAQPGTIWQDALDRAVEQRLTAEAEREQ